MRRMFVLLPLATALTLGCGDKKDEKADGAADKTSKATKAPGPKDAQGNPRLKGTGYSDGIVATPVKTMFSAKRKIEVEIPVAQALNMYKLENDGKGPQSQEQFEQMITKHVPNLPKPQAGFYYHWNVKEQKVEFLPVKK